MDEILKRLGLLETSVAEIRAVQPHLATRADLHALRADLKEEISAVAAGSHSIRRELETVRTEVEAVRAEVASVRGELKSDINLLRADMNARETRMIRWVIGAVASTAALAFSAARFVH